MSQPITVNLIDDDDDNEEKNYTFLTSGNDPVWIDLSTPLQSQKKRQRLSDPTLSSPRDGDTVFVIDEGPTPEKNFLEASSSSAIVQDTPPFTSHFQFQKVSIVKCSGGSTGVNSPSSFVAETPMSELNDGVPLLRCNVVSDPQCTPSLKLNARSSDTESIFIHLESDNESETLIGSGILRPEESTRDALKQVELSPGNTETVFYGEVNEVRSPVKSFPDPHSDDNDTSQLKDRIDDESYCMEEVVSRVQCRTSKTNMKGIGVDGKKNKEALKEERLRLKEEKRLQKEQEKLQKAAQKAEAVEMKKLQKEKQKWEKGKLALKSIVADIDSKVVEVGSVGGHLLARFAEKGISFRITSNPIKRSIIWTMDVPEELSKIASEGVKIPYVLVVYEAEEFCNLVASGSLMDQVSDIQCQYPHRTVCFLTNKLFAYINKREQGQYKNPGSYSSWKRPPVEEALALLSTHFVRVHTRQCVDEAELAEHVIGLTCSLASCQFRKRLTRLSVNANGSLVSKDSTDRDLIKKSIWLKALVSIPKVQPRFAVAIWKKYPTMKSLLCVYMDPNRSVHEKEFLLKDLTCEGLLGDDRRLGEICSKRVYRILMAQCPSIKTDDVENGADFFKTRTK